MTKLTHITKAEEWLENEVLFLPNPLIIDWQLTGSYYICNPPVTTTDIDVLILTENHEDIYKIFVGYGIVCTSIEADSILKAEYPKDFVCYRYEQYNFIVTDDPTFYIRFAAATEYCKHLNIQDKTDRINIFKVVLHDEQD